MLSLKGAVYLLADDEQLFTEIMTRRELCYRVKYMLE